MNNDVPVSNMNFDKKRGRTKYKVIHSGENNYVVIPLWHVRLRLKFMGWDGRSV